MTGVEEELLSGGMGQLVVESTAIAISGGLVFNAVNSVRKIVGNTVDQQNAQVNLAAKLREAELRLLEGDYETEEEAVKDREDARRMKALLMKMEMEAEKGEGIQMDSQTAKPLTLTTYFVKSFRSLLVNRNANLKDGDAPVFQRAITLTLLACFAWQLSGLLGLAFDPSRT